MINIAKEISSAIVNNIKKGFYTDTSTLEFIHSAYGLYEIDEIASFIEAGDDGGTVSGLISFPDDNFRESVERLIPSGGLTPDNILIIESDLLSQKELCFMFIGSRKIILSESDSRICLQQYLKRLNLQIPLSQVCPVEIPDTFLSSSFVKAQLRKRKFIETGENSLFLNDLIHNYSLLKNNTQSEFLSLLDISSTLLSGSEVKPLDLLSEKKYFYDNAIMEAEEFSLLMKTYSMEFIMMKRIQPPLISIDEARSMIKLIDRLTSIVYGMIIPSVNNVVMDGF